MVFRLSSMIRYKGVALVRDPFCACLQMRLAHRAEVTHA